jgi:hypothetical protein
VVQPAQAAQAARKAKDMDLFFEDGDAPPQIMSGAVGGGCVESGASQPVCHLSTVETQQPIEGVCSDRPKQDRGTIKQAYRWDLRQANTENPLPFHRQRVFCDGT